MEELWVWDQVWMTNYCGKEKWIPEIWNQDLIYTVSHSIEHQYQSRWQFYVNKTEMTQDRMNNVHDQSSTKSFGRRHPHSITAGSSSSWMLWTIDNMNVYCMNAWLWLNFVCTHNYVRLHKTCLYIFRLIFVLCMHQFTARTVWWVILSSEFS